VKRDEQGKFSEQKAKTGYRNFGLMREKDFYVKNF
jgi:hypothetical protein